MAPKKGRINGFADSGIVHADTSLASISNFFCARQREQKFRETAKSQPALSIAVVALSGTKQDPIEFFDKLAKPRTLDIVLQYRNRTARKPLFIAEHYAHLRSQVAPIVGFTLLSDRRRFNLESDRNCLGLSASIAGRSIGSL